MGNETTNIDQEIEDLAYVYMDKKEIALITGIPVSDLADDTTNAGAAFLKGRLKRKAKFNQNITKLSDQLSSPAQAIELKLSEQTRLNDKKR